MPLTLLVRWGLVERTGGPHFDPKPDALEYAAAAQALALEGRFCLHVGPHVVRPRYAPGWPMMLSVAIRLGMDAESLWRLSGLFGAAQAYLLAIISSYGVRLFLRSRCAQLGECAMARRALIAGVLAGCGWAFTPLSVEWNRTLMSDEAAAFLSTAALFAVPVALLGEMRPLHARLALLAAGLSAGWAIAMRPVVGYLLLGPALIFLAGGVVLHGWRRTTRLTAHAFVGLALVVVLVMGVMRHSGYTVWEWSGYRLWLPDLYGQLGQTFSLEYALHGHPSFALHHRETGEQLGNLEVAGHAFLGLRGLPKEGNRGLGRYWPMPSWLCGAALLWAGWRMRDRRRLLVLTWGAGVLCWIVGHIVIYSLYFYPAMRFYLAPLSWVWVGMAVACATWWGGSRLRTALLAYVAASAIVLTSIDFKPLFKLTSLGRDAAHAVVRQAFTEWLALSDAQRAASTVPFDPVQAQALGLLTPDVLSRIGEWGTLPETEHLWRLRSVGYIK